MVIYTGNRLVNLFCNIFVVRRLYLWTMMIPHLVKNYKVSLPEEFMHYLRKQNKYANQYGSDRITQILDSLEGKKNDSYMKFSDN